MARKPIPKSIRFEVFKRDKFTCQYCGSSAPDVILEVDHIKPVAKGGTNDLMNLVTSCRDCNRGKQDKVLSDSTSVKVQRKRLEDMQERREQLAMMLQWREALEDEVEQEITFIDGILNKDTDQCLNDNGRRDVRKLIRRFGFDEVCTSCDIAMDRYYDGTDEGWYNAFNKIGGICFNRKKARENGAEQDH